MISFRMGIRREVYLKEHLKQHQTMDGKFSRPAHKKAHHTASLWSVAGGRLCSIGAAGRRTCALLFAFRSDAPPAVGFTSLGAAARSAATPTAASPQGDVLTA